MKKGISIPLVTKTEIIITSRKGRIFEIKSHLSFTRSFKLTISVGKKEKVTFRLPHGDKKLRLVYDSEVFCCWLLVLDQGEVSETGDHSIPAWKGNTTRVQEVNVSSAYLSM